MTKKSIKKKVATKKVETKKSDSKKAPEKSSLSTWAKLLEKEKEQEKKELRLEDAIEPLGARILVIRDTPEAITRSGIIIPTLAQDRPNVGTVVRSGEGCLNTWNTGDRVLITESVGREITVSKWTVVLLDEDDVMMRFSKESNI
tara:strand:+ start:311 stop:745 length:435 start_codon:yes stop_codon:yes gene_type:complete